MTNENESAENTKEVFIVKRITKMDSDDYISIQLKSSDDTIEELLHKAMSASKITLVEKSDKKLGIQ